MGCLAVACTPEALIKSETFKFPKLFVEHVHGEKKCAHVGPTACASIL